MAKDNHPGLGNLKGRASNAERFPCTAPYNNMDQYSELVDFLPKGYQYHVCKYRAVSQSSCGGGDHISFEATVRLTLQSKEEFLLWLKFMPVTWRVAYTRPTKGQKTIFKTDYRCQHNTRTTPHQDHTTRRSKNTGCPAKLKVSLVRTVDSRGQPSRSTDPHVPNYPTIVDISNIHNHNIHVADAVRHRDVGSVAVEKLTKLFEAGHSPSSALDVLKYDLQVEYGDDYIYTSADRSICPDLQFCYRLYQQIFKAATEDLERPEATDTEELRSQWKEFSDTVLNNEALLGGASAMLKTFNKIKGNPSMLLSALHMFGRCGTNSQTSQQARALQRVANRAGPSIAAQPTSVARRKMKLGDRRRLTAGRPKKSVAAMDHRYSYPKGVRYGTHSFSQAVEGGRSNPK
ncbi:uncharacterized protein LOC130125243 [Lampris incognitus]|uniref:uncharacterized protein LOC130125243 n=1 Tax=Lampris incognitus TaxID=2546036 RepID=UPI0024B60386|nr:uncharacterized protein LOC130125243 [Lampris incognitus]